MNENLNGKTSSENLAEMLNKVPEVTILFWIVKVMATTVGETGADFLIFKLKYGLATTSYLMTILLVAALYIQIVSKKYVPWIYWLAVVMVSVVGTLITDNLVDNLGVRLETTTIAFSLALIATFVTWHMSQKTLSIHTIYTLKRESFYWAAILFTFALGTAAGDLVSESERWHLGYAISGMIFAALIGIVVIAYYFFKANAVTSFWIAYVLTRPLGASLGDYLSQSHKHGGLGLGTVHTSIAFLVIIVGSVVFWSIGRKAIGVTKTNIEIEPV